MKWCSRIAEDIGVGEDASTAAKATLVYQVTLSFVERLYSVHVYITSVYAFVSIVIFNNFTR